MRGEQIKRAHWHDAGAYGQCSYCERYSDNPKILDHEIPCDCGKTKGWCDSFESPQPDSIWSENTTQ
jgi:hypothetical protein